MQCHERKLLRISVDMMIQIFLVFGFLTLFFFAYVSYQEQQIFKRQMDILVDDLMNTDILPSLRNSIANSGVPKNEVQQALSGALGVAGIQAKNSSKDAVASVKAKNTKTRKTAFISLGVSLAVVIAALVAFKISKTCSDLEMSVCITVFVVLFVALTEFSFLMIISAKYISVDPNNVRSEVATAINSWLNKNKDYK